MNNTRFKELVIPTIYLISVALVIASIVLVVTGVNKYMTTPTEYDYVINKTFNESTTPVINTDTNLSIIKPYLSEDVTVGRYFYDFESPTEDQQKSIIYYENTYMQNTGVDYVSNNKFDVISILDGEVISIESDSTLGNIIKIQHDNNLISVYEGIEEITLTEGSEVTQGEILGVSGTSKINPEYNSSLHFEVYYKGEVIDPENIYTLTVADLEE